MTTAIISPVQTNLDNARARVRQASDRLDGLPSELGLPYGPERDARRRACELARQAETEERTFLKAALEAAYKSHQWETAISGRKDDGLEDLASCRRCGDSVATMRTPGGRLPIWMTPAARTLRACPGAA